jgi:putative MATE family efflux protein
VLQNLFQTAQFIVDTRMISDFGGEDPVPMAAVAVVGPLCWSLATIFTITSVGATALVARRIGEGRGLDASKAASISLLVAFLAGLVVALFAVPIREVGVGFFRSLYGDDGGEAVSRAAASYLDWYLLLFPLRSVLVTLESVLRGAGESLLPFWGGVVSNLANVAGNALLIFGLLGLPRMGVEGAGLSTALAPVVELVFLLLVLRLSRSPRLRVRVMVWRDWSRDTARELLRISGPAFLGALIFHSGFLVYQAAIFGLPAPSIAAHRVAITIQSIGFLTAAGFYASAASLSGRLLGSGDPLLARRAAGRNALYGLLLTLPMVLVFLVIPRSIVELLTEVPESIGPATMCVMLGAIEIPFLMLTESLNGTLRGAGATRAPMVITALGTWGMRVPLSWILTQETSLGLAGVWVATVADWALRALLTAREVHRGNWLREELAS